MIEVRETEAYARWFKQLRDDGARGRILARVRRLSLGNPGDVRSVGQGVLEMRIRYGPGYRVYFAFHGATIVILLGGGAKSTQARDIAAAIALSRNL